MIATGSLSSLEVSRPVLCCSLKHRPCVQAVLSMCDSRDSLPGLNSITCCLCDLKQVFNCYTLLFLTCVIGTMIVVSSQGCCENEMSVYVKETEQCVSCRK